MLSNRECKSICRNLKRVDQHNGDTAYMLHHTAVVTERRNGKGNESLYVLNTDGWTTALTRTVMSDILRSQVHWHIGVSLYDEDLWFHDADDNKFWIGDSLTINKHGLVDDYNYDQGELCA